MGEKGSNRKENTHSLLLPFPRIPYDKLQIKKLEISLSRGFCGLRFRAIQMGPTIGKLSAKAKAPCDGPISRNFGAKAIRPLKLPSNLSFLVMRYHMG